MSQSTTLVKMRPDPENQALMAVQWLRQVELNIPKIAREDLAEGLRLMKEVEILEVATQKLHADELWRSSVRTRFKMQREFGKVLQENVNHQGGRPKQSEKDQMFTLDKYEISRKESSQWQMFASVPDDVFAQGLENSANLSAAYLSGYCQRYESLKSIVDKAELKDKDATLKMFVSKGYSPAQAVMEINPSTEKLPSYSDVFGDEEEEEESIPDARDVSIAGDMDQFAQNAEAMDSVVREIKGIFAKVSVIDKASFGVGLEALKRIRAAVQELTNLFKTAKEKVQ